MVFEYRSTSDFGTKTSLEMGTVTMATDYDEIDPVQTSKLSMQNMQYSAQPSLKCDPSITFQPMLCNRCGSVPSGRDPRLYDHGTF
jgi:hypothetical protein